MLSGKSADGSRLLPLLTVFLCLAQTNNTPMALFNDDCSLKYWVFCAVAASGKRPVFVLCTRHALISGNKTQSTLQCPIWVYPRTCRAFYGIQVRAVSIRAALPVKKEKGSCGTSNEDSKFPVESYGYSFNYSWSNYQQNIGGKLDLGP